MQLRILLDHNINAAAFALFWRAWGSGGYYRLGQRHAVMKGLYYEAGWKYNRAIRALELSSARVGPDTVFIPFHFSGWWQGEDMLPYYPEGAAPIVRGEAVNTATTYGYDRVTMMQETKTTLCEVAKA